MMKKVFISILFTISLLSVRCCVAQQLISKKVEKENIR